MGLCKKRNAPKNLQGAEKLPGGYWRQKAVAGVLASLETKSPAPGKDCGGWKWYHRGDLEGSKGYLQVTRPGAGMGDAAAKGDCFR